MADFTTLTTEIINTTENDSTEFLSQLPNIVNRAEERLTDELDDYGLVTYTSVAVSQGNNIVTLPSGTRIVKNFNVDINVKDNTLTETGEVESENEDYLYKGISTKKFFKVGYRNSNFITNFN